ncbi:MAG: hypothetical protein AAF211_29815 [Myxococcota bacterium]
MRLWLVFLSGCSIGGFQIGLGPGNVDCTSVTRDADLWLDRGRGILQYTATANVRQGEDEPALVRLDGGSPENGRSSMDVLLVEWSGVTPGVYRCEENESQITLIDGFERSDVSEPGTWCELTVDALAVSVGGRVQGRFVGELESIREERRPVCGAFDTVFTVSRDGFARQ